MALNFYARRWLRTLPLYYAFFAASAFVTIFGIKLDPEWSAKCLAYVLFLQNLAWPMLANWYHETWSLAIEEWFYLLFPLMFAALSGFTARTRVLVIALTLIVAPLALRIWLYDPASSLETDIRHVVALRLDTIAYGILAAWVVRSFPNAHRWSMAAGAAGLLGFVVTLGAMAGKIPVGVFFLHTFSLSLSAASFAAIVFWANFQNWRDVSGGVVGWFSTRSYALYLCHGCVVRTMLHKGWFAEPPIASLLIFSLTTLLIAEAAHRLIERPAMRRRPRESFTHPSSEPERRLSRRQLSETRPSH
jgi:peptidoglycan/LPS O-acetylase OafA/YrhL